VEFFEIRDFGGLFLGEVGGMGDEAFEVVGFRLAGGGGDAGHSSSPPARKLKNGTSIKPQRTAHFHRL
jgi:hypothetical protein